MTCRDCVRYNHCADLVDLAGTLLPNWIETFSKDCECFEEAPVNDFEDAAAANSTMDEVGAQLINLYAEYSRMAGYTDDDYAKAVCIAVRMLSD